MAERAFPKQSRWSKEEIDELVRMTNNQLELEAQDASKTISWKQHWKAVSARLKQLGYRRSFTACRGIWNRGIETQRANRDAAGDDWDDSEHEILVHMTKKQLDLEKVDRSNVIPWATHWKRVSLQLEESGYDRTPDNCASYWQLIENGSEPDVSASEMEDEADENEDDENHALEVEVGERGVGDFPALAASRPQSSSKTSSWSVEEYENLLALLKRRRELEEKNGLERTSAVKMWTDIARLHMESGYDRSMDACKSFWNYQGRDRSGFDERVERTNSSRTNSSTEPATRPSIESSARSSVNSSNENFKPSNISYLWSLSNNAEYEESEKLSARRTKSQPNLATNFAPRPKTPSTEPTIHVATEIGADNEYRYAQNYSELKKRGSATNLSTPVPSATEKDFSEKKGHTRFRFTPDQKAILTAEAALNGNTISSTRRAELAQELGVEDKTVRNWFTNYNARARRYQDSGATAYAYKGSDDGLHGDESKSTIQGATTVAFTATNSFQSVNGNRQSPNANSKRPYAGDVSSGHAHPLPKKTCLETEGELRRAFQGFKAVNAPNEPQQPTNTHTPHAASPIIANYATIPPENTPTNHIAPGEQKGPAIPHHERMIRDHQSHLRGTDRDLQSDAKSQELIQNASPIPSPATVPGSRGPSAGTIERQQNGTAPNGMVASLAESATTRNPSSTPARAMLADEDDPKGWAAHKIQVFRRELEILEQNKAELADGLATADRELVENSKQHNEIQAQEAAKIERAIMVIKTEYQRHRNGILQREAQLHRWKEEQTMLLKKNDVELAKKEKGLKVWQGIVDYYKGEGVGEAS